LRNARSRKRMRKKEGMHAQLSGIEIRGTEAEDKSRRSCLEFLAFFFSLPPAHRNGETWAMSWGGVEEEEARDRVPRPSESAAKFARSPWRSRADSS
jgi:hypothetical protein